MTASSPFERHELRQLWASLRPESLIMASRRLSSRYPDLTPKVLKNERARHAECFPEIIPIVGGESNKRLSIYAGPELDYWAAHGRTTDEVSGAYTKLRGRTLRIADQVGAVQLAAAAAVVLPDEDEHTAARRIRGWRENREANSFPDPLPIAADYTIAAMVFCLHEIIDWATWYLDGDGATVSDDELRERHSARALRGARTRRATQAEAV